jgi:hypothetical protein
MAESLHRNLPFFYDRDPVLRRGLKPKGLLVPVSALVSSVRRLQAEAMMMSGTMRVAAANKELRGRVEQLDSVQKDGHSWDSATQSTAGVLTLLPNFLPRQDEARRQTHARHPRLKFRRYLTI